MGAENEDKGGQNTGTNGQGGGSAAGSAGQGAASTEWKDGDPLDRHPRFQAVVGKKRAAEERVSTLERELQSVSERAATADTLAQQLRDEKEARKKDSERFQRDSTLMGAGLLDAEAREVANFLYDRLPENDRPPLGDWLSAIKADPAKGPRALQPWFTGAASAGESKAGDGDARAGGQAAAGQAAASATGKGSGNSGIARVNADGDGARHATQGDVTQQQIKAAREKAVRTGDWSDYEAIRKQVAPNAPPVRKASA